MMGGRNAHIHIVAIDVIAFDDDIAEVKAVLNTMAFSSDGRDLPRS
jgi:hypothetical protein